MFIYKELNRGGLFHHNHINNKFYGRLANNLCEFMRCNVILFIIVVRARVRLCLLLMLLILTSECVVTGAAKSKR